ncbi:MULTISPECIES: LytTR family DNA-binding domain-containing protein [Flavobacteriaceae]|uniref:LytR/AlgR family response regulator transcription factor n=1 Tax=Flavobacteriaceae TaxID=49546 RepID=UPI001491AA9F|nr:MULTISPECIES: LytTR family transcriptional regulator DNA-binding domain-containing protein [Allomuricauda]MDC6364717.1 LytTR family transcriptional regulator DNA-binding domain-containing protein [Muricauda sp. AC10]
MQILIIEDEARAANQLQNLLQSIGFTYELLETIDSVEESVQWFQKNKAPDLVFMDIQLADGLSFEIFQKVQLQCPIIFTTAFDQYAIRAFKVNSVDYLLKPIQQDDLQQALNKFKRSKLELTINPNVLRNFLADMQVMNQREGILVKEGDGFAQIRISELLYVYSEDSLTFGVTAHKRVIIDETLDQLYPSLDTNQFFRINRGQIVAKSAIEKIAKYFNHRLKLSITQARDQEFIVSRPKINDFKDWLNR